MTSASDINAYPVALFPAAKVWHRRYVGYIRGIRYEGIVGLVRQTPDGVIQIDDSCSDFAFWFNRHLSPWLLKGGNLEIHIMYAGVFTIYL